MAQRVLVRGSDGTWWMIVLRVVALLLILAGLGLALHSLGWLAVLGAIVLAVNESLAYRLRAQRRWIEDTGDGFVVVDNLGERRIRDEQVDSITRHTTNNYSEGLLKSVTRDATLWAEGSDAPITMKNTINVGSTDPLGDLLDRVQEKLRLRAEEALERGGVVSGGFWSMVADQLAVHVGGVPRDVGVDELSAVDVFGDHICVWQRGQEEAFTKIPIGSRNAHLLWLLLQPRLSHREESASAEPPSDGLGRVLFERSSSILKSTLALLGGACLVPLGLIMLFTPAFIGGLVMMAAGGGLLFWGATSFRQRFRCHEFGVYQSGLFGESRIRYGDVASFSYSATRHFTNGVYTGTNVAFGFQPLPGVNAAEITYSTSHRGGDDDLETLCNHISGVIAARMANDLAEGRTVAWTPNMTFRPDGIEYRPSGWIGRKDPVLLPYEQVHGFDMQQGTFYIWSKGEKNAVMQESVSEPNFFPGYFLLVRLFTPDEPAEQSAAAG
jgi:hypothetical protein